MEKALWRLRATTESVAGSWIEHRAGLKKRVRVAVNCARCTGVSDGVVNSKEDVLCVCRERRYGESAKNTARNFASASPPEGGAVLERRGTLAPKLVDTGPGVDKSTSSPNAENPSMAEGRDAEVDIRFCEGGFHKEPFICPGGASKATKSPNASSASRGASGWPDLASSAGCVAVTYELGGLSGSGSEVKRHLLTSMPLQASH